MGIIFDIVIWVSIGAVLGFIIPFVAAQIYVLYIKISEGDKADLTGAGAFSFIPLVSIPLGAALGFLVGILGILPIFRG